MLDSSHHHGDFLSPPGGHSPDGRAVANARATSETLAHAADAVSRETPENPENPVVNGVQQGSAPKHMPALLSNPRGITTPSSRNCHSDGSREVAGCILVLVAQSEPTGGVGPLPCKQAVHPRLYQATACSWQSIRGHPAFALRCRLGTLWKCKRECCSCQETLNECWWHADVHYVQPGLPPVHPRTPTSAGRQSGTEGEGSSPSFSASGPMHAGHRFSSSSNKVTKSPAWHLFCSLVMTALCTVGALWVNLIQEQSTSSGNLCCAVEELWSGVSSMFCVVVDSKHCLKSMGCAGVLFWHTSPCNEHSCLSWRAGRHGRQPQDGVCHVQSGVYSVDCCARRSQDECEPQPH